MELRFELLSPVVLQGLNHAINPMQRGGSDVKEALRYEHFYKQKEPFVTLVHWVIGGSSSNRVQYLKGKPFYNKCV